ncbi:MAG: glycosyltransferase family 4 protein [Solirubrobacteraceae bacterium]
MPEAAGSPRLLWVADQAPDSSSGGGGIRQAYLFQALARRYSVDLLLAGSLGDEAVREAAARVIEVPYRPALWTNRRTLRQPLLLGITLASPYPLTGYLAAPARRELTRALRVEQDAYDLVLVEQEELVPLVPAARSQPWVMTFHNLLSGMLQSEADLASARPRRWFRKREVRKARRLEARALRAYDHCITCSAEDARALASAVEDPAPERISVIPNGVDLESFREQPVPEEPRILFPGTLSYPPNVDGAIWLCSEIWPRVQQAVPEATLVLAGRSPAPAVARLADMAGVEVHADVPSMAEYFERARVVAVPLRVGTGTRIKALQAMAAGRPVVGTSVGLEGLGIVDGVQGRVADDPQSLAEALIEILQRRDLAAELGRAGRRHVEAHFDWNRIGDQLVELVGRLLEQRAASGSMVAR